MRNPNSFAVAIMLLGVSSTFMCVADLNAAERNAAERNAPEPWHQFRGPQGNGHSKVTSLPTVWSDTEHVRWKIENGGKAWSSPVVWGDQIWVTNAPEDGKKLFAQCLDARSGKLLHDILVFDIAEPQFCIPKNSYASCTPCLEEGRVYVHFGSPGTAAIDTQSGKVLWTRQDLPCNHHRGAASSPVLFENLLILTFDGFDLQYTVALDKNTGKTVWKRDRNIEYDSADGDTKKAYGTPSVFEVGGKVQLVSPSAGATIAYDPHSGKEIWRVRSGGMNASCRPIHGEGMFFVTTADGGFKMFAVRDDGNGDVTGSHVIWKLNKGVPRYGSPILVDGLLYMGNEGGMITCVDARTSDLVWQERLGGLFTASPIYAAGHVYFFSEDGAAPVLEANRKFKLVANNKLEGGFMASPAVMGNQLILRTTTHTYCIGE